MSRPSGEQYIMRPNGLISIDIMNGDQVIHTIDESSTAYDTARALLVHLNREAQSARAHELNLDLARGRLVDMRYGIDFTMDAIGYTKPDDLSIPIEQEFAATLEGLFDPSGPLPPWQDRLTFGPNIEGKLPVVKGTDITVAQVVSFIIDGYTWSDILHACPKLTEQDIRACLWYVCKQEEYRVD